MKCNVLTVCLAIFCIVLLYDNSSGQDYNGFIQQKKFSEALQIIQSQLDAIYSKRSIDKKIPDSYIAIEKIEEGINLQKLFTDRKLQPYFIENNDTLYTLHINAALCYQNMFKYNEAVQHYFQSLRFTIINEKDHPIFYSLALLFKRLKKTEAYLNYLEEAYEIKPDNYDYSLELALALASGKNKKKALFHLNRYIQSKGSETPPELYLTAANCYESIGDFINAGRYYQLYLNNHPDDAAIQFALGYLAFTKISDMKLAYASLTKGLSLYGETDLIRKGISHSIIGDITSMDLNYTESLDNYLQAIQIAERIQKSIEDKKNSIEVIKSKINTIKSTLLDKKDISLYPEYQSLMDELGNSELELRRLEHEYSKLNTGELYFKIASIYENTAQYQQAIDWYNKAIASGTKIRESSKKIEKIQLKISRGY
jgi:tetratricopeptide (TPR) repeat protein